MCDMKRILCWCGKHKVWAYFIICFIITMLLMPFGVNPAGAGRIVGLFFIPYLLLIMAYNNLKVENKG